MISKETVSLILDAARIEEVIGDFVQLKKTGSHFKGLSPFSTERTPSFIVSPTKGIFKDFSSGKGGSAVTFLMEHEKFTYPEALKYLAAKYNITIEEKEQTADEIKEEKERESLFLIMQFAEKYFSEQLTDSEEGKSIALSYFRERGFGDSVIKKFSLGYNPEGRDSFTKTALEKGYKLEYLIKLGLTRSKDDRHFDFFQGRVMFPIHSVGGRVIGFGGRTLRNDKNLAKYFNSPESELYNKSRILYGLFQAKNKIVSEDNCYLVEGYTDVVSLQQAGIENVVASSGTALTKEQIALIRRYTKNITILYDGDKAGIKASFRGIDLILEAGMTVRVILFPDGHDPDSFSKSVNSDELIKYLQEQPKDFITFKTLNLLKDSGNDPIKKAEVVKDIVGSIALIPDGIFRSTSIRVASQVLDMDEQVLLNELNRVRGNRIKEESRNSGDFQEIPPSESFPADNPKNDSLSAEGLELELLRILINYGHLHFNFDIEDEDTGVKSVVEQNVADFIIETIVSDEIVFEKPLHLELFGLLQEEYRKNPLHLVHYENPAIASLATDLCSNPYQLSENWYNRHFIKTATEADKLEKVVKESLYAYLLRRIQFILISIQEKIKLSEDEDLLVEYMNYEKAKIIFSKELNRVIIK